MSENFPGALGLSFLNGLLASRCSLANEFSVHLFFLCYYLPSSFTL